MRKDTYLSNEYVFFSYYRVQYDDVGFARLIDKLKHKPDTISLENKIELIADSIAIISLVCCTIFHLNIISNLQASRIDGSTDWVSKLSRSHLCNTTVKRR